MNQDAQARCEIYPDALLFRLCAGVKLPSLPQIVTKIISFFDGAHTLGEACGATQISVDQGLAIVKKLTEMGFVETSQKLEFEASMSEMCQADTLRGLPVLQVNHFSQAEEEFFSAEILPLDESEYEEPYIPWRDKMACFFSELVFKLKGTTAL